MGRPLRPLSARGDMASVARFGTHWPRNRVCPRDGGPVCGKALHVLQI